LRNALKGARAWEEEEAAPGNGYNKELHASAAKWVKHLESLLKAWDGINITNRNQQSN